MRTLTDKMSVPPDADANTRAAFMNIDRFSPTANSAVNPATNPAVGEPDAPLVERLRTRVRVMARNPRVAPIALFVSGVAAALLAILIYQALTPAPHLLTTQDVSETVAQAFASATPEPALSVAVYKAVQPSLVFIESETPGDDGNPAHGVGSGVIINDQGDILTSLHVVTQATSINLTFADGTKSSA